MKLDIFIDIRERINSKALWDILEGTGANVTDLGTKTLVYGTISMEFVQPVLMTCLEFGDAIATITATHRN